MANPCEATEHADRPPLDYPAGREIGDDATLPYGAKSVYCHLATTLGFTHFRAVKVWATAHTLGMHEDTVSRGLRLLAEHGYIEAGEFWHHGSRVYRLVRDRAIRRSA